MKYVSKKLFQVFVAGSNNEIRQAIWPANIVIVI